MHVLTSTYLMGRNSNSHDQRKNVVETKDAAAIPTSPHRSHKITAERRGWQLAQYFISTNDAEYR